MVSFLLLWTDPSCNAPPPAARHLYLPHPSQGLSDFKSSRTMEKHRDKTEVCSPFISHSLKTHRSLAAPEACSPAPLGRPSPKCPSPSTTLPLSHSWDTVTDKKWYERFTHNLWDGNHVALDQEVWVKLPFDQLSAVSMSHVPHTPEDALSLPIKWDSQRLWWLYNVSCWLVWTTLFIIPFLVWFWVRYGTRETLSCSGGRKGSRRHVISSRPSPESSFNASHSWARCLCSPWWQLMPIPTSRRPKAVQK